MKRKFLFLLLTFLMVIGCNQPSIPQKDKIIKVTKYDLNEPIQLDVDSIEKIIDARNDFILYLGNHGCFSCNNFTPIINKYVKDNQALVYTIDIGVIERSGLSRLGISFKDVYPPLIFLIQKGKMIKYLQPDSKLLLDKTDSNQQKLTSWLNKTLNSSLINASLIDISFTQLKLKLVTKASVNLLVTNSLDIHYREFYLQSVRPFLETNQKEVYQLDLGFVNANEIEEIKLILNLNNSFASIKIDQGSIQNKVELVDRNYEALITLLK